MSKQIFIVQDDNNIRLDVFLTQSLEDTLTRSHIKKLIVNKAVKVNKSYISKSGFYLKIGDEIEIEIEKPAVSNIAAEDIPLDIIYQDNDIAVINKQRGLVVHPGAGVYSGTLVNALLYHIKDLSGINGEIRPGIVHRIDKDTTGLLLVAKNDNAHLKLSRQIAEKSCQRFYKALVEGVLKDNEGTIDAPIDRHKRNRTMMCVAKDGRRAVTHYRVLERFEKYTLVEFKLETGRTHQIRVHCKYINHPIAGDPVYNPKKRFDINGQLLHAYKLIFRHPKTEFLTDFTVNIPEDFQRILDLIKKEEKPR